MARHIYLEFDDNSLARLRSLKDKTEATSIAEVVKNALRLYEGVVEFGDANARVIVSRGDGTTQIVPLFQRD